MNFSHLFFYTDALPKNLVLAVGTFTLVSIKGYKSKLRPHKQRALRRYKIHGRSTDNQLQRRFLRTRQILNRYGLHLPKWARNLFKNGCPNWKIHYINSHPVLLSPLLLPYFFFPTTSETPQISIVQHVVHLKIRFSWKEICCHQAWRHSSLGAYHQE